MAKDIVSDIPPVLLNQLDKMIKDGLYKTRVEAIREGIRLLVRKREVKRLREKIKEIKLNTKHLPNLSQAVVEQHI